MFNAKPDGYTVGILPMPAAIAQEIQDPDLARWKTRDFTVLGSRRRECLRRLRRE